MILFSKRFSFIEFIAGATLILALFIAPQTWAADAPKEPNSKTPLAQLEAKCAAGNMAIAPNKLPMPGLEMKSLESPKICQRACKCLKHIARKTI